MKSSTKIWLIIAASLLLIGTIMIGVAMIMMNWDFSALSTRKYVTNHYDVSESFANISIVTTSANVQFLPSRDGSCTVVCHEHEKAKHTVNVEDGTLVIQVEDNRKWYDHIGISFTTPKITVYLPQGQYANLSVNSNTGDVDIAEKFIFENVNISVSTGDIHLAHLAANRMNLSVSTGDVTISNVSRMGDMNIRVSTGDTSLTNIRCNNLISTGSTGDVILNSVIAKEKLHMERGTGDVEFSQCDGGEIFIKTTTGDITGTLLSEKVFHAHANTGDVEVPASTTGGRCEITTNTGDIEISIVN